MAPFSVVEFGTAKAARGERRQLRCPSCCTRIELADGVPEDWRVLHRCGNHVIEVTAGVSGALGAWRWRALAR